MEKEKHKCYGCKLKVTCDIAYTEDSLPCEMTKDKMTKEAKAKIKNRNYEGIKKLKRI